MYAFISIVRYPPYFSFFGFLSMAVFRVPFWVNKNFTFYKMMGSGKNGTFSMVPDFRQWIIFAVSDKALDAIANVANDKIFYPTLYGRFIAAWLRFFRCKTTTYILQPLGYHGVWNGKSIFGKLPAGENHAGRIAVLTRATIRLSKLKGFWSYVKPVSKAMKAAPGFIFSIGIGERPWIRQATFSIWENKEFMQAFAYNTMQHTAVIKKTRKEAWYSEEMFARFAIVDCNGDACLK